MPDTDAEKKRKEREETLAALRRNQTKVPTAEEGTEMYQEGEGQGYGTRTRRTVKMSNPSPSPSASPSASPSPTSAAGQAKALRSGGSPYDSMTDAELAAAARSSPLAAQALAKRKKGGQ